MGWEHGRQTCALRWIYDQCAHALLSARFAFKMLRGMGTHQAMTSMSFEAGCHFLQTIAKKCWMFS